MRRYLKWSTLIAFFHLQISVATGQPSKYIYIDPDQRVSVLSDHVGNSLFIWQKDKVVRITFNYEKQIPPPKLILEQEMTSLSDIIPNIQRYQLYKSQDGVVDILLSTVRTRKRNRDNRRYSWGNEDEYLINLSARINEWNQKFNTAADTLAMFITSEGLSQEFKINTHENLLNTLPDPVNVLPILVQLPGSDSIYLIRPKWIDIYKRAQGRQSNNKNSLVKYSFFSHLSLVDERLHYSIPYLKSTRYRIINKPLVQNMYDLAPMGKVEMLRFLSQFEFSANEAYDPNLHKEEAEIIVIDDANSINSNTMKEQQVTLTNTFDDKYSPQSYDSTLIKIERIKNQSPLIIPSRKGSPADSWSYLFSAGQLHFFKIEWTDYMNPYNKDFRLMVPGVGFWTQSLILSDISNSRVFKINDRPIFDLVH